MLLGRNVLLLFLIAYVKGKRDSNFLHEVYVISKTHPESDPLVGCIIQEGMEVLVSRFPDPDVSVLGIRFRNENGEDDQTDVDSFKETQSASFLILIPRKPIPMSGYAKSANYLDDFGTLVPMISADELGQVNSVTNTEYENPNIINLNIGQLKMKRDPSRGVFYITVKVNQNIVLLKGATLVGKPNEGRPIVLGMFEQKKSNGKNKKSIVFNIVDKRTTRAKIIISPSVSTSDTTKRTTSLFHLLRP